MGFAVMKRLIGLSLSIALGLATLAAVPATGASDNSRNNIGDTETSGVLVFLTSDQVHTFAVTIPKGSGGAFRNGRLTIDTQDCCVLKDFWGVRIIKHNGQVMDEAIGDGSGYGSYSLQPDVWSGAASIPALTQKGVMVEIYWDSSDGTPMFPAGMLGPLPNSPAKTSR